jgi:SAM-dependent methyltransferase
VADDAAVVAGQAASATAGGSAPVRVPARVAVVWETLQAAVAEHARAAGVDSLDVLDLGGGTGGLAVPLAELGHRVTVVDPSPDALAALDRRAAGLGSVRAVQGDADDLLRVADPGSYDVVVCHGVLEHVDDVRASLQAIVEVLRPAGLVSVVAANRHAAVVARTLAGHFADARRLLTDPDGRWGPGDPLPRRFDAAQLLVLLDGVGLQVRAVRGARVLADLVPGVLVDAEPGAARSLLDLERELAGHPAFRDVAVALHVLAARG